MSEYGEGHSWSLGRFGKGGPALRRLVPRLAYEVHGHFADTQGFAESSEIVKVTTRDVYGRLWRPLFDTFAEQIRACIPNSYAWRPAGAKYKVVMVNNWLVFPFRCGRRTADGFQLGEISPLRRRMLNGDVLHEHEEEPMLPLDLGPSEPPVELITAEDAELIEQFLALRSAAKESAGVVAVIMSSNPYGIQTLEWGEVDLGSDGTLVFTGFHEDLMWAIRGGGGQMWPLPVVVGGPVGPDRRRPAGSSGGFAEGEPAEPPMQIRGREDSQPGHEPPAEGEDVNSSKHQDKKDGSDDE